MSGMSADKVRDPLQCLDLLHDEMSEQIMRMKEVQKEIGEMEEITRDKAIELLADLSEIDLRLASCLQTSIELNMILIAANRILRQKTDSGRN